MDTPSKKFTLTSSFSPKGDQPEAIKNLIENINAGGRFTTLIGVTGSGKTFTIANLIAAVQKTTLVITHNKTLAAQLCNEYKGFFPENAVEYFVSYYDYYQPEAYIPHSDTYIEKDASINKELDRLRHSTTQSLLLRKDTIVVSSVSCLYGIGAPGDYESVCLKLEAGMEIERDKLLRKFVDMQYTRVFDDNLKNGAFRVKGGVVEIMPSERDTIIRLNFLGDELKKIGNFDPAKGRLLNYVDQILIFPATHYVILPDRFDNAFANIEKELEERVKELEEIGKTFEAERLKERTKHDLEIIKETGYCHGIENYSRHFDNRKAGEPPATLIEYFPSDFLIIIDESHVSIPQLRAMYNGDKARKKNLIDHGFRLPSAYDNRPLNFDEFLERCRQVVFVSATPGKFELGNSASIVEQIIRPTGLLDPEITIKPSKGQISYLTEEIKNTTAKNERILVTTLTKKMAEKLTDHLIQQDIKARYLHSDIETLDRIQIIYDLRLGVFDVIVGINLLREGLDIPEVSLVTILDADKEGFLRSDITLIQTMGRAARNANGRVILFADNITDSMTKAINETKRRRKIQMKFNKKYNIIPQTIIKDIKNRLDTVKQVSDKKTKYEVDTEMPKITSPSELSLLISNLEIEMWKAADIFDFERAAEIRDKIQAIKNTFKTQPKSTT